jgi:O-antigen/teichoic acid export membrane protein
LNVTSKTTQTFFAHSLIILQGFILIPLVVKISGVEEYGLYVILLSLFNFIYGISSFGYGYKAARYLPSSFQLEKRSILFTPQFYFQIVSVILLATCLSITIYYGQIHDLWTVGEFWIPLLILFLLVHVLYAQGTIYLRYTHRVQALNIVTSINPILFIFLAFLIYSLTTKLNVNILFLSSTISMALISIFIYKSIFKEISFKIHIPKMIEFKQDIALGLPLTLSYLVETVIAIGDRYVIAYFMTVKDVGSYSVAYAIGGIIIIFAKVFGVILPPILSKKIDLGKTEECINIINKALRVYLIVSIPFVFASFIFSKEILYLIANKEVSEQAWLVLPIISFATIFFGINMILSNVLFVQKKTSLIFKANSISSVVNILLNIIFLGLFKNIESAAISTVISHMISFIVIQKNIDNNWIKALKLKFISYLLTISILTATIVALSKNILKFDVAITGLLCGVFIGFFTYLILLFITKSFIKEEADIVKRNIINFFRKLN